MQFTVRIPDEYGEKIALLANNLGLKRSDIARLALKKFVDENLGESHEKPFQKVSHLIGVAESGVEDLGQRHREHLKRKARKMTR